MLLLKAVLYFKYLNEDFGKDNYKVLIGSSLSMLLNIYLQVMSID